VVEPLQRTLVDITTLLENERIAFALIGGQATSLRGEARLTADVDMIIAADVERALSLVAKLPTTSFSSLFDDITDVVQRSFILPLRHRTTNIKVDLAVGLSGFERQAVARAEPLDVASCRVPVATAEDLILMKVLAGRPRDDQDLRGLVVAQGAHLDWEYCESTAMQLGEALGIDMLTRIRELRKR
jgi:hypothetical protein